MHSIEFPVHEHPRVSILIVAWRQHSLLESCLRALARSIGGRISYEVIVVLNGATPEVEAVFHTSVRGVRVVHSPVNLGFAGGNNRAASVARGEAPKSISGLRSARPTVAGSRVARTRSTM